MARIYREEDIALDHIKEKLVGILGYGSQGHAHAQNLRDSGCRVVVGVRKGRSWEAAEKDGFEVLSPEEAARRADIIAMLVPDPVQPQIYREAVERGLSSGKALLFAHGFNIRFGQIIPPPHVDVILVAPKCPGHVLRELYQNGMGAPALIAVHQDASGKAKETALAYAKGIGCARAGVIETTFAEETETDLFGEQVILCGGVSALIKAAFETLVEAGYQPEVAYFECLHELKLIVDLIYRGGLSLMRHSVSDTAEYGDYTRGPRVIDERVREEMRRILGEIQNGTFAREWILEGKAGLPVLQSMRMKEREHLIEEVGRRLRALMPWLQEAK